MQPSGQWMVTRDRMNTAAGLRRDLFLVSIVAFQQAYRTNDLRLEQAKSSAAALSGGNFFSQNGCYPSSNEEGMHADGSQIFSLPLEGPQHTQWRQYVLRVDYEVAEEQMGQS